jgi:hypothetical protein
MQDPRCVLASSAFRVELARDGVGWAASGAAGGTRNDHRRQTRVPHHGAFKSITGRDSTHDRAMTRRIHVG